MKIPKGKWQWNDSFTIARVIHYWGIWPPSRFWEASEEDQAWAISYYEHETGIQAWDQYVLNIEHEKMTKNLTSKEE